VRGAEEASAFCASRAHRKPSQFIFVLGSAPLRCAGRTVGVLQEYVPNEGDAWTQALDVLQRFFEDVLSQPEGEDPFLPPRAGLVVLATRDIPDDVHLRYGPYVEVVQLLGRRTGEMHLALAAEPDDPAFAPEPFTLLYQRSVYQSFRTRTRRALQLLRHRLDRLDDEIRPDAELLVKREDELLARFERLKAGKYSGLRTRIHGDYHLGQVLYTGRDFVIIDFEGEPARPLGERRLKRSPLRDVAGMLRSFHYAAYAGLFDQVERGVVGTGEHLAQLEEWARYWHAWTSAVFLRTYLEHVTTAGILPGDDEALTTLLEAYLLEKAVYELGYELNNRPAWLRIPLQGVGQLLRAEE
jgi:maltose alpha-D-glucosyltransferase / alpha-amylase